MFQKIIDTITSNQSMRTLKDLELYPLLNGEDLLASPNRQRMIKEIRSHLDVSEEHYRHLYHSILIRTAEFTQSLPETLASHFSYVGGMLDYCMESAATSLAIRRQYESPLKELAIVMAEQDALWSFAVFTAALLSEIGKLGTEHVSSICDENEELVRIWLPYQGPMTAMGGAEGSYYRFSFVQDYWYSIGQQSSLVLALTHIIPPDALQWLASYKPVFNYWLAVMTGDYSNASTMGAICLKAKQRVTEKDKEKTKYDVHGVLPPKFYEKIGSAQKDTKFAEHKSKKNTTAGRQFVKSLRQAIKNGTISVNGTKSPVHVTKQGVLVTAGAFKAMKADMTAVSKSLSDSKRLTKTAKGETMLTYSNRSGQTMKGVVLAEVSEVFHGMNVPNITGKWRLSVGLVRSWHPPPKPVTSVHPNFRFTPTKK